MVFFFFFFNDTAPTEIYTLPLHDALPIYGASTGLVDAGEVGGIGEQVITRRDRRARIVEARSEEHTSELQSQSNLVCRLLLEKKKKKIHELYVPSILNYIDTESRRVIQRY